MFVCVCVCVCACACAFVCSYVSLFVCVCESFLKYLCARLCLNRETKMTTFILGIERPQLTVWLECIKICEFGETTATPAISGM